MQLSQSMNFQGKGEINGNSQMPILTRATSLGEALFFPDKPSNLHRAKYRQQKRPDRTPAFFFSERLEAKGVIAALPKVASGDEPQNHCAHKRKGSTEHNDIERLGKSHRLVSVLILPQI
jgi:hypothetical protein